MSWNVENLFDMTNDGDEYPEYKPNHCNWNDYMFQLRLHNLAEVIVSAHPDIVVLCEVENRRALDALAETAKKRGFDFPYRAIGDRPNATGTNPAILSRFPVAAIQTFGTVKTDHFWSRNILEAAICVGRDTLIVFATHWPSKSHAESFRVAAARVLEGAIRAVPAGSDYVIAGDFNADYDECEKSFTQGLDDANGITGINHVLGTVDSKPYEPISFVTEQSLFAADSNRLFDLWLTLPEPARASHWYQGQQGTIDHILVPRALFDNRGLSYLGGSFHPFTMHDSLLKDGEPYRWQVAYGAHCNYHKGAGYSDHLPLIARLSCGPAIRQPVPQEHPAALRAAVPGIIGFETGFEGWVCEEKGIHISRDTIAAASGRCCLRINGATKKENVTLARIAVAPQRLATPRPDSLVFAIRGTGPLCVRVREKGNKKWVYFIEQPFRRFSVARYTGCRFSQWTNISLPLAGILSKKQGIEIEIRGGKNATFSLWIDNVRFK
jgi:endonuclease/exonuclease/phosphatase family metal-dependent hydrolase